MSDEIDSLLIPLFFNRLTSHVSNVCLKFNQPESQVVSHLQEALLLSEISFKQCTILLRFTQPSRRAIPIQKEADVFAEIFSLKSCLVHFSNSPYIYRTDDEASQILLKEWLRIID